MNRLDCLWWGVATAAVNDCRTAKCTGLCILLHASEQLRGTRRYARGWLCVDVLTSLPLDRILCAASAGGLGYVRFIKILRLLKVRGGARGEEEDTAVSHDAD
jgi:hypothetical protein